MRRRLRGNDRQERGLRGAAPKSSLFHWSDRGSYRKLFRARSSTRRNLPFVPGRSRDVCGGLRIMRQPRWECLATFITSSMKQVAHIRQISQTLRKRYGKRQRVFDFEVYTFPPASRIAKLTEQ